MRNEDTYIVSANVETVLDGWNSARSIPTFSIAQNGNSLQTAAMVAIRIVDPYRTLTVHMYVMDPVSTETYCQTFLPE